MRRMTVSLRWLAVLLGALIMGDLAVGQTDAPVQTGPAQSQAEQMTAAVRDLQRQIEELRSAVAEVHSEAAQYRAEAAALRAEIEKLHSGVVTGSSTNAQNEGGTVRAPGTLEERVASLEETTQLLNGKVDEQYQSKVESASKYKVRLSGMMLLNMFSNHGSVDTQDFPSYAATPLSYESSGAMGATIRQSQLGLEVFGPTLLGARSSGHFQFDFAGGFPNTLNGVNYGLFRVRIGNLRLDWAKTSVIAGQDEMFLSPLAPTSFATVAEPAFSYAGNLWGWIPQVRIEHRFDLSDVQNVTISGGILDNVDGEPPYASFNRVSQAGERIRQPAYGSRVAWTHMVHGQPLTMGVAGFYSRQDWGFNRYTDGWAGMTDWQFPLMSRIGLSGEFYRGRAIGALGGGVGRSVLFSGSLTDPATRIRPLNSIGGWSQLKLRATNKLEFNGGVGLDNPYSSDLHWFPTSLSYYNPALGQNRSALVNFIYRPRSNLLLSSEYRRLRTFQVDGTSNTAEQVNLIVGVLF